MTQAVLRGGVIALLGKVRASCEEQRKLQASI
jgi:hypothetical protein